MSGFKNLLDRHVAQQSRLEALWPALQQVETLLVQVAAAQNRAEFRAINPGVDLPRELLQLLIRADCGFDFQAICPIAYQARYPFSETQHIRAGLEDLVESRHLVRDQNRYCLTSVGRAIVTHWMTSLGHLIDRLDLGTIRDVEINWLLAFDQSLVEAIAANQRPHGHPILTGRLDSLHPDYEAPRRWHHWQLTWTLVAAEEDELEFVRRARQIPPLVWFIRRQLWFVERRPWLVRTRSRSDLTRRLIGYAPVPDAERAVREAINELDQLGWLAHVNDGLRLSSSGLSAHDTDERQALAGFVSSWPDVPEADLDLLEIILERLTDRLSGPQL